MSGTLAAFSKPVDMQAVQKRVINEEDVLDDVEMEPAAPLDSDDDIPKAKAKAKSKVRHTAAMKRPATKKTLKARLKVRKDLATKAKDKPVANGAMEQKKRRWRPGTKALREIRKYQKSTDLLLRKLPFQRLVREIAQDYKRDLRFQGVALLALQGAAEAYLTAVFKETQDLASGLCRKITISPAHLAKATQIVDRIRRSG